MRAGGSWRGLLGVLLAFAALSVLSLYRQTLGFPVFYLGLLATMLFWTTQATSWNLLSGYSGYFSFGQAAYVGVGAYTTAVLYGRHQVGFFVSMLAAAALAGLLALAVGALAFRLRSLRGEIFALLTLAVPFILAAFARINPTVDGGQGIVVPVPPFPAQLGQTQDFLYLVDLAVAGLAVAAAFAVQHARIGWALTAVRDAEDVGEALGVATFRYKLQAIVLSAVIAGVSGSVFAVQIGFVTVDGVFTLTVPLFVIVMSVLGGRTHWLGPVLGAVLIVLLQDRLSSSGLDRWRLLVLGAVLVVLVAAAPDGLYSRLRRRPWPALAAGVLVVGGLRVAGRWGGPADWLLVGMLAAAAVAAWPGRRHRAGRTVAGSYPPGQPDQPAAPRSAPAGPASVDPPAADATVLVDCRQVTRYFGGVRAVSEVSLQIRAGELVGLVGPNGSGKTTLVGLLSGALQPTSGSIRVAGRDISGLPPHRVAHCGIARTYQIPRPFGSMTVRDNVALAVMFGRHRRSLADSRRAAEDRLGFVGLDHLAGALPAALNLHQRQLLEIARAIATEPAVLFLDEALAGLNPAEIDNAVRVIKRIHRSGVAIVIIEHVLRVVNQLATRIVVLDRGTRLADGDPRTVLADPAVVAAYLGKRAHA